jgi:hypothetical protein
MTDIEWQQSWQPRAELRKRTIAIMYDMIVNEGELTSDSVMVLSRLKSYPVQISKLYISSVCWQ